MTDNPQTRNPYVLDCTGDVVAGDRIRWEESVFGGSRRRPRCLGTRIIEAKVLRDSYGGDRQQHTFSLEVTAATGTDAPAAGAAIRRKGRNLYRNGTMRVPWDDEGARRDAAAEKHARGDAARALRDARRHELAA